MTFNAQQTATQQADSAELYAFTRAGKKSYFTSYYRDVEYSGRVYRAATLERGELSNEFGPSEITCRISGGLDDVFLMLTEPTPVTQVTLEITKLFIATEAASVIFSGRLMSYSLQGGTATAEFSTELFARFGQKVPRVLMTGTCNNALFDSYCGRVRESYEIRGKVTYVGVDGNGQPYVRVEDSANDSFGNSVQSVDATWWNGGMMRFGDFYRSVTYSDVADGDGRKNVRLQYAFPATLAVGALVKLYPGCDKTTTMCAAKFANTDQYLGVVEATKQTEKNVLISLSYTNGGVYSKPIPVVWGTSIWMKGIPLYTSRNIFNGVYTSFITCGHWILLCWGPVHLTGVSGVNETFAQDDSRRTSVNLKPGWLDYDTVPTQFNPGDESTDLPTPYVAMSPTPLKGVCTAFIIDNVDWYETDPALRNVIHRRDTVPIGFRDFMQEINPYYDDQHYMMFKVNRYPTTPWSTYDVTPYYAVNVVSAIYEVLTNTRWGAAFPVTDIDIASFEVAAIHCYNREYAVNFVFDTQQTVRELLDTFCTIGNLVLCYSEDYKIQCKVLTSADSLTPAATLLDEDFAEFSMQAGTWESTYNRFVAPGQNGSGNAAQVVMNEVNVMISGSVRTLQIDGLSYMSYAGRNRRMFELMRDESFPRAKITCTVDQRFFAVTIGDCVRVTSTRYSVNALFRVTNRTLGTVDDNNIKLQLTQISEAVLDTTYVEFDENQRQDPSVGYTTEVEDEEFLAFPAYSDTSAESVADFADLTKVRVAWGDHPILRGTLLTNLQDPINFTCVVGHGTGDKLVVYLAQPRYTDAIQGNALGLLNVKVWKVVD